VLALAAEVSAPRSVSFSGGSFDQLDEALDAEVGEGHDALVVEALDPDQAVLWLHCDRDVEEESLATRSMIQTWESLLTCLRHAAPPVAKILPSRSPA
jgi:hypothetical protein